jgi:hypothetical protein
VTGAVWRREQGAELDPQRPPQRLHQLFCQIPHVLGHQVSSQFAHRGDGRGHVARQAGEERRRLGTGGPAGAQQIAQRAVGQHRIGDELSDAQQVLMQPEPTGGRTAAPRIRAGSRRRRRHETGGDEQ